MVVVVVVAVEMPLLLLLLLLLEFRLLLLEAQPSAHGVLEVLVSAAHHAFLLVCVQIFGAEGSGAVIEAALHRVVQLAHDILHANVHESIFHLLLFSR